MSSGDLAQIFGGAFDPNSVEPAADFEVLPPGKYPCLIEESELKSTKKGDGYYVKLVMSVLDGQFKGRKVFDNINISNPNQQAMEIGQRSLSALALAIGLPAVTDTAQLANQCVVASVKVKDGDNQVRTYLPIGGQQPPQQSPPAQYQQPQQTQPPAQQPPQQQTAAPPAQYQQPQAQTQPPAQAKPPWAR